MELSVLSVMRLRFCFPVYISYRVCAPVSMCIFSCFGLIFFYVLWLCRTLGCKYIIIHIMGWWTLLTSEPISSGRDELIWEQMEHKVVFSIFSQTTHVLPFCAYSCQIGIQMLREMKFCMSYWGDTTIDYNYFCLCSAKPAGPSIEQILAATD